MHTQTKSNTWAVITGASSGFGEEFARQYAARGHSLVLVARRKDRLEQLAESLRSNYKVEVVVEGVDLSDLESVRQLHQRVQERGIKIDVLINNAGYGLQGGFQDANLNDALGMVQLDIASLTAVTHLLAADMRARGSGKILLVSSLLAQVGVESFAVYAAAKAYVLRFGEALHREMKKDGITVTTLCPGLSDTGFAAAAQMHVSPPLKLLMMKPEPVVKAGIRALNAGRISVVPGLPNKFMALFIWATPRWLHQAMFAKVMSPKPMSNIQGGKGTMTSPNQYSHLRLLASSLMAALLITGCTNPPVGDPRIQPPTVAVCHAKPAQSTQRTFTGVVDARVVSALGFRLGGKVLERFVSVGQHVKKGQLLMKLDAVDLQLSVAAQQANVAAARARYTQAKADEARVARLVKTGAVSNQEYDLARASLDSSKALLEAAEAQAKVTNNASTYAELLADADGVIVRTAGEPGQVVSAGQMVMQLAQDGPREALIHLPEGLRPDWGSAATAQLHGQTTPIHGAKLRELSDAADPTSRTFEARYVLEGDAAQSPLGSTVVVTLTTPQSPGSLALSLPIGAIHDSGTGPGVWIVEGTATVNFRSVKVDRIGKDEAVLSSGLKPEETVVALGAHMLHEGQTVRITTQQNFSGASL